MESALKAQAVFPGRVLAAGSLELKSDSHTAWYSLRATSRMVLVAEILASQSSTGDLNQ
jgi:hypothetical protein